MLIIENKSDSCVTVNVNGYPSLSWPKRGSRIDFPDAKKDYLPYQNAVSAFMQVGMLKAVSLEEQTQAVEIKPVETLSPQTVEQIPQEPAIIKRRRKANTAAED